MTKATIQINMSLGEPSKVAWLDPPPIQERLAGRTTPLVADAVLERKFCMEFPYDENDYERKESLFSSLESQAKSCPYAPPPVVEIRHPDLGKHAVYAILQDWDNDYDPLTMNPCDSTTKTIWIAIYPNHQLKE